MRKLLTLSFVVEGEQVLLGMKKRGFGAGRWNGFGGKVEPGESIETAAARELREECGIEALEMELSGIHEFEFEAERGTILEVHVFRVGRFTGDPVETEEMRPEWFSVGDIPYDTMWPDDRYWLPLFLRGERFRAYFLFGPEDRVLEKRVEQVATLEA
jgi:8-oxo-dGTP diphosphatase/2-hydroxy-dATP diphosphatase